MRNTKFRAWHKVEKKMCKVSVLNLDFGVFLVGIQKGVNQQIGDKITVIAPNHGKFCHWDEIILMQCTGLKDKNGKEIYEGDIMETHTGWHTVVRWNEKELSYTGLMAIWEVVGNIHQNKDSKAKDLLK